MDYLPITNFMRFFLSRKRGKRIFFVKLTILDNFITVMYGLAAISRHAISTKQSLITGEIPIKPHSMDCGILLKLSTSGQFWQNDTQDLSSLLCFWANLTSVDFFGLLTWRMPRHWSDCDIGTKCLWPHFYIRYNREHYVEYCTLGNFVWK